MKNTPKFTHPLALFCVLLTASFAYAQNWDSWSSSSYTNTDSCNERYIPNHEPLAYHSIDYSYYPPAYGPRSRNLNDPSRFGQRYDNSDNFSSGISSYQGTSTGPGPNGGYPGTPRGVYPTNYVNTSLYPNTYSR